MDASIFIGLLSPRPGSLISLFSYDVYAWDVLLPNGCIPAWILLGEQRLRSTSLCVECLFNALDNSGMSVAMNDGWYLCSSVSDGLNSYKSVS